MLTPAQQELWNAYQAAEAGAPRAARLRALSAFLDSLAGSPEENWFPWARTLAARLVDEGETLAIRWPLLERAVVPAVLAGYRAGLPGCARWLAGFSGVLGHRKDWQEQLPESERTELGLLLAALRHDPADHRSRRRLLEKRAERLCFSLHELPAGVLYGMDGATAEQCGELERELEEFCRLAAEHGGEAQYQELIAKARFHFRAYRDYLSGPGRCRSYAEYLAQEARRDVP